MEVTTVGATTACKDWNLSYGGGLIQDIKEFSRLRNTMPGPIGMTSGGFDPIHPGHITSIIHASRLLWTKRQTMNCKPRLVVVVNGDGFLREKKGREFLDLKTRCQIVSGIRGVDVVIPFEAEAEDNTVIKAIEAIAPQYFFKGGDRNGIETIPEWEVCKKLGTQIITNVGSDKSWSSSTILTRWEDPIRDYISELETELEDLGWKGSIES